MFEFAAFTTVCSCFKILCVREGGGLRILTITLISLIISWFSLQLFTRSLYAPKKLGVGGHRHDNPIFYMLILDSCEKKMGPSLPLPDATCLACTKYLYIFLINYLRGRQATSLKNMMLEHWIFFFFLHGNRLVLGILMKWYKCYNNCWRICFKRKSIRGVE